MKLTRRISALVVLFLVIPVTLLGFISIPFMTVITKENQKMSDTLENFCTITKELFTDLGEVVLTGSYL